MIPKPPDGIESKSWGSGSFVHIDFETIAELHNAFPVIGYNDPIRFTPADLHGNLLARTYDQVQRVSKESEKASLNVLYGTHRAGKSSVFRSLQNMFPANETLLLDCSNLSSAQDFNDFCSRFKVEKDRLNNDKISLLLVDEINVIKSPEERRKILEFLIAQGLCTLSQYYFHMRIL